MNKQIKPLIFSDMDGTLYNTSFKVLDTTKKDIDFAITKSSENFNPADFNLATGNPLFERVHNIANYLNARFIIASSGAQIYDNVEKRMILEKYIDDEVSQKIIAYAQNKKLRLIFFNSQEYFYLNCTPEELVIVKKYHFDTEEGASIVQEYKNQKIEKIAKFEFWNDTEKNPDVIADLNKIYDNIVVTHGTIEIMPKDISKGQAIEYLLKNFYPAHTLADVMAAGDSGNDISMLSICGYSYAMANSQPKVFPYAKYYTSAVEQNGLGEAIIDYLYRFDNIIKKYLLH
ncbi:Cof-type HAD-IIB family hydrolase [[Mycoplasma] gypis]|uniref:Cof-type HAD-IIB family hydrolase n=1 Tax=[Mycoplasma] gypis TaxID=92404 RepID=A0ABZ2RNC9_9BACT|nr:Cof-type HAD-IIB family hydrolase [[Mycoplasma] gypis]MBN0919044.1 HAD family phosphatase [[Mycoplasma] gypis]